MKHIYKALIFSLVLSLPSLCSAKITFDLDFADAPGTGFHTRPEAKQALLDALESVATWISFPNDLTLHFTVLNDKSFSSVASFSFNHNNLLAQFYATLPTFKQPLLKSAYEKHNPFQNSHGLISVNLDHPWSFSDPVPHFLSDFKGVITHEFIHALGFVSLLECQEGRIVYDPNNVASMTIDQCLQILSTHHKSIPSDQAQNYCNLAVSIAEPYPLGQSFSEFDRFIQDQDHSSLVDSKTMSWPFQNYCTPDSQASSQFFFSGQHSASIPLASTQPLSLNSFSHISDVYPFDDCIMNDRIGLGPLFRQPCLAELNILKDLGYNITIQPRPNIPVYSNSIDTLHHGESLKVLLADSYDTNVNKQPQQSTDAHSTILGSATPSTWVRVVIDDAIKVAMPLSQTGCSTYDVLSNEGNAYSITVNNHLNLDPQSHTITVSAQPQYLEESLSLESQPASDSLSCTHFSDLPKALYFKNKSRTGINITAAITHPASKEQTDPERVSFFQTPSAYLGILSPKSNLILYIEGKQFATIPLTHFPQHQQFYVDLNNTRYTFLFSAFIQPNHHFYQINITDVDP